MDYIRLEDIRVLTRIGTLPHEQDAFQTVEISANVYGDFRECAEKDDFRLTFDYSQMEKTIFEFVSKSHYQLLEALAQALADEILKTDHVLKVRLEIVKPAAARIAKKIQIVIEREKDCSPSFAL